MNLTKKTLATMIAIIMVIGIFITMFQNISFADDTTGIIGFEGATIVDTTTVRMTYNENNVDIQLLKEGTAQSLRTNGEIIQTEVEYVKADKNKYAFKFTSDVNDEIEIEVAGVAYSPDSNGLISFSSISADTISNISAILAKGTTASNPGGGGSGSSGNGNTEATINYTYKGSSVDFTINSSDMADMYQPGNFADNGNGTYTASNHTMLYNSEGTDTEVTFRFSTLFITVVRELEINGTDYTSQLPTGKVQLAEKYTNQHIEFEITVPKTGTYTITTNATDITNEEGFMGNFLWENDPNKESADADDIIDHGSIEFVKAVYNGTTYTSAEQVHNKGGVFDWSYSIITDEDLQGTSGGASFPTGTMLTVKLKPDAGYQLTSFGVNGGVFEPQENIGEYTFEIKPGNFHLAAKFTKVDDAVKTTSDAIQSGSIALGGTESSMAIGTARLDVDNATITDEQVTNFEQTAGDYTIQDYLDISLFNTVYKGSASSSWDTEVTDLNNNASITLKLEDNLNGNDAIIVHEKHDGTYETIDTTYDAEENTITFETDSFSNYAIAAKTTQVASATTIAGTTSTNPTTGDIIMMFVGLFAISTVGFVVTRKLNKRK